MHKASTFGLFLTLGASIASECSPGFTTCGDNCCPPGDSCGTPGSGGHGGDNYANTDGELQCLSSPGGNVDTNWGYAIGALIGLACLSAAIKKWCCSSRPSSSSRNSGSTARTGGARSSTSLAVSKAATGAATTGAVTSPGGTGEPLLASNPI